MPVRHRLVLLALLINMLCYTDRVCIAAAAPELRAAFQFTPAQMGLVFSIFSLSYFLGQMPWGLVADRWGARGLVTFAVAGWSAFTILTAFAWSYLSLLVIRFLFGALEAAFSPAVASAFNRWIPLPERATAFGLFLGGGRLGGAITPTIVGFLLLHFASGWRLPFLVFGAIGVLGAAAWFYAYRNHPHLHPRISPAELATIRAGVPLARAPQPTPWAQLLRSPRLWCLLGVAFGATFLWQFYITWFPFYLRERRGLSITQAGFYAGLPFLLGMLATWCGGFLTDWLGRRRSPLAARRLIGLVSLLGGASMMLAGVVYPTPAVAALLMASAAGFIDLYLGAAWASATDIGGSSGGAVAGLMNAASNCAGFASPALMGFVLHRSGNWDAVLLLSVATTLLAALLWSFVNPRPAHP
jgi:MFS family permease